MLWCQKRGRHAIHSRKNCTTTTTAYVALCYKIMPTTIETGKRRFYRRHINISQRNLSLTQFNILYKLNSHSRPTYTHLPPRPIPVPMPAKISFVVVTKKRGLSFFRELMWRRRQCFVCKDHFTLRCTKCGPTDDININVTFSAPLFLSTDTRCSPCWRWYSRNANWQRVPREIPVSRAAMCVPPSRSMKIFQFSVNRWVFPKINYKQIKTINRKWTSARKKESRHNINHNLIECTPRGRTSEWEKLILNLTFRWPHFVWSGFSPSQFSCPS